MLCEVHSDQADAAECSMQCGAVGSECKAGVMVIRLGQVRLGLPGASRGRTTSGGTVCIGDVERANKSSL